MSRHSSIPTETASTPSQGAGRRFYPWLVFALSFGLLLSDYMSRQVLNAVFPLLKVEWALSDTQLGALGGVVALMVGLLTIPLSVLADRWGRVRVARAGGVLIATGGALIALTDGGDPGPLLVGFALVGFGGATLVPSAYSAAARMPGVSEGAGVTIVSWLMRVGFLFTSPLIGAVAEAANLRWGLGILILVGAATVALAGALAPARTGSPAPSAS